MIGILVICYLVVFSIFGGLCCILVYLVVLRVRVDLFVFDYLLSLGFWVFGCLCFLVLLWLIVALCYTWVYLLFYYNLVCLGCFRTFLCFNVIIYCCDFLWDLLGFGYLHYLLV